LNLFAAADGYGAFLEDVTVNMSAASGGFAARDVWRNDITGNGGLIKQGTGELGLAGNNRYAGGTKLQDGTLRAMSEKALGTGSVTVMGGTLYEDTQGAIDVSGDYAQSPNSTLVLTVDNAKDIMKIKGKASVEGTLVVKLGKGWKAANQTLIKYGKENKGSFTEVKLEGVPAGVQAEVVQRGNKVVLNVK
jgi:autotransporter-associated beta strand protein